MGALWGWALPTYPAAQLLRSIRLFDGQSEIMAPDLGGFRGMG
jgi:hypothetical protein